MSNPDWTGPYWQDDASAGRRGAPDDQSAWDDAGFWRTDDGRPARSDGWQSANGTGRGRGSRRAGGSRRDDNANGNGYPDERPRSATGAGAGTRSARANAAGRFGASANDLKNRFRGAVPDRGRAPVVDDATDQNFWGDSMGRADRAPVRAPGAPGGSPGRRHAAGPRGDGDGADWTGAGSQGRRENGAGGNGYRGARRANGNGNGTYRNGSDGYENGGYENGDGARGYADGGQQAGGRTALRDRIQDGVRSRTGMIQRGPGGPGGRGGGGWDDGGPGGGQPGGRWQRFKRYVRSGKWWRHWTWKKVLGLIGGGIAAVVLLGALAIFIIYEQTPIPTVSEVTANWASSTVYFAGGQQMGVFDTFNGSTIDRQILTESQIPPIMNDAMIAAEDRNFMHEGGISITGLVRSAYDDVLGSGNLQGGSTITMQYAKNYYAGVNTGQNAGTKLKEIFIAMKLAHKRSKQWILTSYLNTVPFGPTTDGVGAAAQNYFNINLAAGGKKNQLTFEQAAVLAAMPNSPGFLSPDPSAGPGYLALKTRWHYVLENMVRDGNITAQQASAAVFPKYNPPKQTGYTGVNGYLMTMVKQQLEAPKSMGGLGLTEEQIATGGYRIKTTFSMPKIRALARAVAQEKAVLKQQAALGAGSTLHNYDHFGAALIDPKTGAITAIYGGPGFLSSTKQCTRVDCEINAAEVPQEVGSSFKPYVLATAVNENMNVFTSKLNGIVPMYIPTKSPNTKAMELALSVTGPVPGATNITPTSFDAPNGTYYAKIKAGCDSASVCTALAVNVATATSSDPAFMDLAHRDGITAVINMAQAMGVGGNPFLYPTGCQAADKSGVTYAQILQHCNDFNGQNGIQTQYSPKQGLYSKAALANGSPGSPQVALGQAPLTPIEQASMIATLADGGMWHMPHVIASITSATHQPPKVVVATRQVLSAAGAADVDWALSFDNNMAGATAMGTVTYHPGGIIAKTGTIGNGDTTFDAWFVGAVPKQQAMAVDLYANDPGIEKEVLNQLPYTPSGMRGSLGGAWPASIWNAFFTNEFPTTSYQQVDQVFPTTNGYPFVPWIQAKPAKPKLQFCKFGQTQNCKPVKCHGGRFFGQPCTGGNPTPTPTCSFPGQQNCTNPTPNPTQTCFPPGQCNQSPSPTPSPSPSPSCTLPGPCNTLPAGTAGNKAKTTAAQVTAAGSVAGRTIVLYQTSLAKIERLVLLT